MKKKIIISALALTIGAGLAGSITGTAAWYQYSTKVNGAYIGASGGATGNLNMRIRKDGQAADAGWSTFLSKETLMNYVQSQGFGTKIQPVTPGALEKTSNLTVDTDGNPVMYSNPVPGRAAYADWNKASKANYIVIPLQLRYVENDGAAANIAKDVYLSELVLEQRVTDPATSDISNALRFHISSYSSADSSAKQSRLVSKTGGKTVVHGKLDLDGDGSNDTARPGESDKYGFNSNYNSSVEIDYGEDGNQVAFTSRVLTAPDTEAKYYDEDNVEQDDADVYSLIANPRAGKYGDDLNDNYLDFDGGNSKKIGTTVAGGSNFLNVDLTIWVEGWQKFQNNAGQSSIWSKSFIGSEFNIGFEFAINAEVDE